MPRLSEDAVASLKAQNPLEELIGRRTKLGRPNAKGIRAGQCLCEPVRGKAPLWVNCTSQTFGCLKPNGCGGDLFDFLEAFDGLDFAGAVARLGGAPVEEDPAALARLREKRARERAAQEERARRHDARERERAFAIWKAARPVAGTLVDDYFRHRGLEPLRVPSLRFSPDEPFFIPPEREGEPPRVIYRGPCMVAAIQGVDDKFCAVHRTWLDDRLPNAPKGSSGKARLALPDGSPADVKKMRGVKKGGAIRLSPAPNGDEPERVLVLGEGIETTATALQALRAHGARPADYFAWAAGDLGNLSGGTLGASTPHPSRPGRFVPSAEPDMSNPGLILPAWASRVILLGDGDSDPETTRARLLCARRRFERQGVPTAIRMSRPGTDFNDLVRPA